MSFDRKYCEQIVNAYLKRLEQVDSIITMSNECDIDQLGACICGLANLALYKKLPYAYALWGINSEERKITGTSLFHLNNQNSMQSYPLKQFILYWKSKWIANEW